MIKTMEMENINNTIITKETQQILPYCHVCQHDWESHTDGCTMEYCSCPWDLEK